MSAELQNTQQNILGLYCNDTAIQGLVLRKRGARTREGNEGETH